MAPKRKTRGSNAPTRATTETEDGPATPATAPMAPALDCREDVPLQPLPMPALAAKGSTSSDIGAVSTASTADELSSLECPICYSYMQPPFLQCVNAHPVCTDCKKAGSLDKCPICRVGIEEDALQADSRLETLAARVELPCSNGCGLNLPYLAARGATCHQPSSLPAPTRSRTRPWSAHALTHPLRPCRDGSARAHRVRARAARLPDARHVRLRCRGLVHGGPV